MSTLLEEIKAQIVSLKTDVAQSNIGTVREISDGVAKIEGLSDAALNEMLDFPGGCTGIALNLEETEVGAIILGDYTKHQAKATGSPHHRQACCRCRWANRLLGASLVNALGQPHRRQRSTSQTDIFYPVEKIAPGIVKPANPSPSRCKPASWRSMR